MLNGEVAHINTPIRANDLIRIEESTAGKVAEYKIEQLPEFNTTIEFTVNDKKIQCPKFATVNGELKPGSYSIQSGDVIQMCKYYTVQQILDFMDVVLEEGKMILVNNAPASKDTKVYDNFTIDWIIKDGMWTVETEEITIDEPETEWGLQNEEAPVNQTANSPESNVETEPAKPVLTEPVTIIVQVNQTPVLLEGKASYMFVDAYDKYGFQVSEMLGSELVTTVNGQKADFISPIHNGDVIEIYWRQEP